jgi:hypothetical protein
MTALHPTFLSTRSIARNRARLIALGIPAAVAGLNAFVAQAKPKAKPRKPKAPKQHLEPSRHSKRLQTKAGEDAGEQPGEEEGPSELAMFIIDGECPR